jgi:hypothetical protein
MRSFLGFALGGLLGRSLGRGRGLLLGGALLLGRRGIVVGGWFVVFHRGLVTLLVLDGEFIPPCPFAGGYFLELDGHDFGLCV